MLFEQAKGQRLPKNPLRSIKDLNAAPWIANSNLRTPTQWTLCHKDGASTDIRAIAKYYSNSSTAIKSMAIAGLGIAILPEWMVRKEREEGKLIQLFADYSLPAQAITIVYAGDHRIRLKCRVFIEFLIKKIKI
ncbi:MAG TPA: hypothetical protein DCS81_06330 [Pantoea septica]|nr:hypothetical protein [Pantoea septica]